MQHLDAEGAAFALLERASAKPPAGAVLLLGAGESSAAYHMSAPHPEGHGARLAMEGALRSAGLPITSLYAVSAGNVMDQTRPLGRRIDGRAAQSVERSR